MLTINIKERELYVEDRTEFITIPKTTITMEHSLASVAEWEGKYHKPFFKEEEKTNIEITDYIHCMVIGQRPDPIVYSGLTSKQIEDIFNYMKDPMTAATFKNESKIRNNSGEFVSAETIYYQMIQLGIPFECQYWHLQRLIALIKFTGIKNGGSKKMSPKEELAQRKAIMAARRAKHGGRV